MDSPLNFFYNLLMQMVFHFRVRVLVCHNGNVLVARAKNKNHVSLPGGHVETGESTVAALRREMTEECGRKIENEHYLGAIEQSWVEGNVRQQEIVHYFFAEIPDLAANPNVVSTEDNLEFFWVTPEEFEKVNFLPMPLRGLIAAYLKGDTQTWWVSNME